MDVNMFLAKNPAEAYAKSIEIQEKINILAELQTIHHVLLKNCLTTGEYYDELLDFYQKRIEEEFIKKYKEKFKEIQEQ